MERISRTGHAIPHGTPPAEVVIDDSLVRALLRAQHPDLAELPVRAIDSGWDNAMYRLGDELAVRLPRRRVAVPLIGHEQTWLPSLAARLPIPVPSPLRVGEPADGYPWPWSVVPWIEGKTADLDPPSPSQARRLADFLRALHRPAPADAPVNKARGVPLSKRAAATEERLSQLKKASDSVTRRIEGLWRQALAAPRATQSRWLHGDLHARNVLVESGAITGIIDWGDVTGGDPATDLACVWMLFDDSGSRLQLLDSYQPSDSLLIRAKGWAVLFGAVLLDTGLVDHPAHAAVGEATLRRLDSDG